MAKVHASLYPQIDWSHRQYVDYTILTSSGFTVPKNGIVMSSLIMANAGAPNRYVACTVNGIHANIVWDTNILHTAVLTVSCNDTVKVILSNGAQTHNGTQITYIPYK